MTIDPRTPVLVGIGVATQREEDPARALEPLDLMLAAVHRSGADAVAEPAALLAGTGRIGVPKGRWRYRNPGGEIARALGAERAVTVLAAVGVLQQSLIGDACRAIADGETDTALVVGGDAGYRILRSNIIGIRPGERQQDDAPAIALTPSEELRHPAELRAGIKMPVGLYAIMESAYRAQHGWTVDDHRDRLAQLYARFSEIAADNPAAWNRKRVAAEAIRDASERNPMQAFPYTKLHCSTWNVDQAGALLFCSIARAEALRIPRAKWIYPVASSESNHMVPVSARANLAACPGAGIAGRAALEAAGLAISDIELVDLYACFPIAVETYAAGLGLALTRDLSVTGAMAFAGGPYNNYVLQATCRMAELLRDGRGRHGLVSSVSGVLTKQGFGLWSRESGRNGFVLRDVSDDVARATDTRPIVESAVGSATVAGYTVVRARGQPPRGVAVVDVDGGRAVVQTEDPVIVARMESIELCGSHVHVGEGMSIVELPSRAEQR
jgi:acetyl-CoA C-acetyltransferase